MRAYIGLGSNLGRREENLVRAISLLGSSPEIWVLRRASLYETEPVGVEDQPWFLNSVVEVETSLPPRGLLHRLKEIERELGREDRGRWGPREIDLDLLLYGDLILEEDGLILPHPELHRRKFVLEPLCELAPELVHPRLKRPLRDLLADLDERKKVIRLGWRKSS
ncbi:MAG: 2-amino-4-hydroxy-6-hydroxymethyldihydropteridine diphosphokinase [Candidatus Bipolaricaulia bacterium]